MGKNKSKLAARMRVEALRAQLDWERERNAVTAPPEREPKDARPAATKE